MIHQAGIGQREAVALAALPELYGLYVFDVLVAVVRRGDETERPAMSKAQRGAVQHIGQQHVIRHKVGQLHRAAETVERMEHDRSGFG